MAEIRVPTLGESVTEATIGKWFKQPGDAVAVDEPLVELETDKVTIEVPAPAAGVLTEIAVKDGETVAVGALLGADQGRRRRGSGQARGETGREAPPPAAPRCRRGSRAPSSAARCRRAARAVGAQDRRRNRHRCRRVPGTGKDGRVTKGDMLAAIERAGGAADAGRRARRRGAGARASPAGRRRARGARAHDAAAPDHRAAPEGGAEHRRHAHDLQRGRHERMSWRCAASTASCSRRSTASSSASWASS